MTALAGALLRAAGGAAAAAPLYVDDVFSSYLINGTGTPQAIDNGIRLGGATTAGWIATIGGAAADKAFAVALDSGGNVFVSGSTESSGSGAADAFLAKFSGSGSLLWQRTLGGAAADGANGVACDGDGNVFFCGHTSSTGAGGSDILLAKRDSNGTLLWHRTIGGAGADVGRGVAVDAGGNAYVVGYGDSQGAGSTDLYLIKFGPTGTVLWQRSLGGTGAEAGMGVAVAPSGDVYVVGYTNSTGGAGDYDTLLAKYDATGTLLWQRSLGSSAADLGYGVAVDANGNAYVTGYSANTQGYGGMDVLLAKYSDAGTLLWRQKFGGASTDASMSVAVDASGNAFVCGYTSSAGAGGSDMLLAKFDSAGTLQWQRTLGGAGTEYGYGVCVDGAGSIFVCGQTTSSGIGAEDILLARLPDDGSGVGAYGNLIYLQSGLSSGASGLESRTRTLTDAARTLTAATTALVSQSSALTAAVEVVSQQQPDDGGLVWLKSRSALAHHFLVDTERGAGVAVSSSTGDAEAAFTSITAFGQSGFAISDDILNGTRVASWTFRRAPKFFDVVAYTGTGVARDIAHGLGIAPGMVIVKRLSGSENFAVYHRSLASASYYDRLNNVTALTLDDTVWNGAAPSASAFSVGTSVLTNAAGHTYIAYVFAHDDGVDGIIKCGAFTTDGTGAASVDLGWEPQFVLFKGVQGHWVIHDAPRGWSRSQTELLRANTTATGSTDAGEYPTATGFYTSQTANTPHTYLAIRRPNKPPASAAEVFQPVLYTGTNTDSRLVVTGIAPDMVWARQRSASKAGFLVGDRLRGNPYFYWRGGAGAAEINDADSLMTPTIGYGNAFSAMDGFGCGNDPTAAINGNTIADNHVALAFRRAPGFFDVVCYDGTGVASARSHSLGVAPEAVFVKHRDGNTAPHCFTTAVDGSHDFASVASTSFFATSDLSAPTASEFYVGTDAVTNLSGGAYVAYLFASLPGICKIGSYVGNGGTQTIDCGFAAGARLVLAKCAGNNGEWKVSDSARGIVDANDPLTNLNLSAADVTNTDWIDPHASGFTLNDTGVSGSNESGKTYFYIAIA